MSGRAYLSAQSAVRPRLEVRAPRLRSTLVRVAATVGCLSVSAAGCSGEVEVSPTDPSGVAAEQCETLIADLPGHVAGQEARLVQPADALAGAWGDPPIVLRCGAVKPPLLRRDSSCFVVNDVGWFAEEDGRPVTGTESVDGEVVFTTIGRSTYVEVTVPPGYQPPARALVDLADVIAAATDDVRPCV